MKGLLLTEFVTMVEEAYSPEMADAIIVESGVPSGGAYTSVGTYDYGELLALIARLAAKTGIPEPDLARTFARHLFGSFRRSYPSLFAGPHSVFQFLSGIESSIHTAMRRLHPDVQLPAFDIRRAADSLILEYRSPRPFADLAEGLIGACIESFGESITLSREDLAGPPGTHARFTLTRSG
jgi:hypothetical protein